MVKAHGRKIKKQVGQILLLKNREDAFDQLRKIPKPMLAGPLFSYFYNIDELIKFRSTTAMGDLVQRVVKEKIENARILLRRIMWNLNDESGGIGWGSVEAMGEILKRNNTLAKEFESILFSYVDPNGNFLEHEMLQRGVLWGVGTYLEKDIKDIKGTKHTNDKTSDNVVIKTILPFLNSTDAVKRGYAVRALINMDSKNINLIPKHIFSDENEIPLFDGWNLIDTKVLKFIQIKKNIIIP